MFGTAMIDIILAIAFVYLLASMMCSLINEWLARILTLRAKTLEQGIRNLLNDSTINQECLTTKIYEHQLIKGLVQRGRLEIWLDKVFRFLHRSDNPSYIASTTFSLVLFDTLMAASSTDAQAEQTISGESESKPSGEAEGQAGSAPAYNYSLQDEAYRVFTRLEKIVIDPSKPLNQQALPAIFSSAKQQAKDWDQALGVARSSIERWYDDSMDRLTGWYKRKTQLLILAIAGFITVMFNLDTFMIVQAISLNEPMRTSIVNLAVQELSDEAGLPSLIGPDAAANQARAALSAPPTAADNAGLEPRYAETVAHLRDELAATGLPLGWRWIEDQRAYEPRAVPLRSRYDTTAEWLVALVRKVCGLLVTALALSLGAPFWFDLLSKVMVLRNDGRPASRAS